MFLSTKQNQILILSPKYFSHTKTTILKDNQNQIL